MLLVGIKYSISSLWHRELLCYKFYVGKIKST